MVSSCVLIPEKDEHVKVQVGKRGQKTSVKVHDRVQSNRSESREGKTNANLIWLSLRSKLRRRVLSVFA